MSDLLAKQQEFARLVGNLLAWAFDNGHFVTFGEAYRTDEQSEINALGPALRVRLADLIATQFPELAAKVRNNTGSGIRDSLHGERLAIDLNAIVNGEYRADPEAYRLLGERWESMGGTWGGRFGDPNHFSLAFGGRK